MVIQPEGTVKLVFQLAEEGHTGGYHGCTPAPWTTLTPSSPRTSLRISPLVPWALVPAPSSPALPGSGRADVTDKGGHDATLHAAINPIIAVSSAVLGLQQLVARGTDPLQGTLVSVTFLRSGGGDAFNFIPESLTLGGTLRSMMTQGLECLMRRIREVVEGQAAVGRCAAVVDFIAAEDARERECEDGRAARLFGCPISMCVLVNSDPSFSQVYT